MLKSDIFLSLTNNILKYKKMRKKLILSSLAVICLFAVSCDDDDKPGVEEPKGSFVIAASGGEATVLLQTDDLKSGKMTIEGNGLEAESATEWEFHRNKYLYRLVYNQGNAGIGSSYAMNVNGVLEQRGYTFEIRSRFTTYGSCGEYIITAAAGATDTKDTAGNAAQGVTFTYINTEAQMLETKTIVTENFLGNGEYVTFSGIVEKDGKIYTAVCPLGVSDYGAENGAGEKHSGTLYPDSVWIAVFDNRTFTNPRIIRDNRLSYATTRFRSQFYTNLAMDDKQNLYVFSTAYESTTTKPSGVLRIKTGTETFDPNFFFDIQKASGGYKVCKPFHVTGDYFLLRMYTEPNSTAATSSSPIAQRLAIFDAANQTFRWVTGLPGVDEIGSLTKNFCADNGIIYVPIVPVDTEGSQPVIYVVDPVTATATKGKVVTCESIAATGKLLIQEQ
jgi:hypothetical protein